VDVTIHRPLSFKVIIVCASETVIAGLLR